MESPLLGEVSFLRRRYEALGAWHGLSIPRANKREAWGGGGVGVGVLSICHCHAVTENTALGQWGRRGGEAQGQGANIASWKLSTRVARSSPGRGPWRLGQYLGCALPRARWSSLSRPLESSSTGYSGVQLAFSLPRPGVGP